MRTGKMRSLRKLIPGLHPPLPGDAQSHVKRIYEHAEEHREEINLYVAGEEEEAPPAANPAAPGVADKEVAGR
jgi:hypothetical protein